MKRRRKQHIIQQHLRSEYERIARSVMRELMLYGDVLVELTPEGGAQFPRQSCSLCGGNCPGVCRVA